MGINPRAKGKQGEHEFINRYQPFFTEQLKRNLLQTREGGSDVSGSYPFVIEIKRCQNLEHNVWWRQVRAAVRDPENEIPVVAFRQNNCKWRFQFPVSLFGLEHDGYVIGDEDVFLQLVLREHGR